MRRTHMILRALCYRDPREAFTYLKHTCKCYRKFFTATQSRSTPSTSDVRHDIPVRLVADFGKIHAGVVLTAPFFATCHTHLI